MKKLLISAVILSSIFIFSGMANALSGTYMFTLPGNDSNTPEETIEAAINGWFTEQGIEHDTVDLEFYAKVDAPDTTDSEGNLIISYIGDPNESTSGTWTSDKIVEFYSVKAGSGKNGNEGGFSFYWLGEGADSADWNTATLNDKGISHLSVWNSQSEGASSNTPEPATMLLLGSGLLGLVGLKRRKNLLK